MSNVFYYLWNNAYGRYYAVPLGFQFLFIAVAIIIILFLINRKRDIGRLKYFPLILFFPIAYFVIRDPTLPLLFVKSAVDPYWYYSYSPGFWAVDMTFWICTPLYYIGFRKRTGKFMSLLFSFSLDFSAVGIFLIFFTIVYGINPFANIYYESMIFFAFMGFVPLFFMRFEKIQFLIPITFAIMGALWRAVGLGNIGYFLSPAVVIDMVMIIFSFLMFVPMSGFAKKSVYSKEGEKIVLS